ncbi:hypothetical protein C0992_007469 [Termitomyces sp. T32_za158]|nr:hypothetical protein C0992_007469 [Termitomyces sp. T32_za158]
MMRMPEFVREYVGSHLKSKKLLHAQKTAMLSTEVSKMLIKQKSECVLQGKGERDIMTLLVHAKASEKENARLSDEEMLGIMRVLIIAGHETTANTLTWALLELSRRPDLQTKLREEIRVVEQALISRGVSQCTTTDLDSMPYLNAILKETLRYHPVVISLMRQAAKDNVIPLSRPVTTTSGDAITELPIEKGQIVVTNKDIFGEDADIFYPERWLDSRVKNVTSVGVMDNLFTFSGGVRACIGWKFAVIQLQAFLFELLGKYEYSATPESRDTRREAAIAMVPTLPGQLHKGSQLKLGIRAVTIEEGLSVDPECAEWKRGDSSYPT